LGDEDTDTNPDDDRPSDDTYDADNNQTKETNGDKP